MTPATPQTLSSQIQRVAADISVRLAQIAKDPPELAAYFRLHAEAVVQALQPVGLSYEMSTGNSFQRAFTHNYESLRLVDSQPQQLAFQRAVRSTAEQNKPVFLDANSAPVEDLHGLNAEDAPAPENTPPHNYTPYQQVFVPIPLSKKVVGVIHAWFAPGDAAMAHARVAILAHAAGEVELYLRARRISDISQELARITTYARFLEDVAGDQDLESVAWKLVNYAREAVGCDRVCLLVDARYGLGRTSDLPRSNRLSLQACSGLRRPHPRSEHAEVLKGHASELLKLAVGATPAPEPAPAPNAGPARPTASDEAAAPSGEKKDPATTGTERGRSAANGSSVDGRPQMRIIFVTRDPAKTATRPEAVNRYFDVIAMNWSTVLPLYDRQNGVCGTLLFEGQQKDERISTVFSQMRDLAVSGGRALSTALVWQRRRTLRGARVLMRWRDRLVATPRSRFAVRYGLPALIAIILLVFPFPYRIRGDATLRPVHVQTLAAQTSGRLIEINAREGDRVKKGQILCVLDSADLRLQLQQVEQDRERAETEASLALQERSETRMQITRLSAQKAETMAEKLRHDIELTVIRAPFDGIVVGPQDITQRRGQVIRIGETVAEVVDPAHWEVKVSVREQDLPELVAAVDRQRSVDRAGGVHGDLIFAASPNRAYTLKLADPSSFAHRLDTAGGKYNFSAVLPLTEEIQGPGSALPDGDLKAGYAGRVRFSCGRRPLAQVLFGDFVRFLKFSFF